MDFRGKLKTMAQGYVQILRQLPEFVSLLKRNDQVFSFILISLFINALIRQFVCCFESPTKHRLMLYNLITVDLSSN